MQLNQLKPAKGSKHAAKRVGRGIGSGLGKTCGRGHKGQKARSGSRLRPDFEGGQNPLYRRLPKFGFRSRQSAYVGEVRLEQLNHFDGEVTLEALKEKRIIDNKVKRVKVIVKGEIKKTIRLKGIAATAGAKKAIEAAGGEVVA
ncbi:MAG: 50S ribosomal protein L15 [Gammaproteobacteria bacterium]|nr:50S ribosomal protein L15 [Gammaproteobacteria bacterium]MCP4473868.1 50S ribosomal protein L15 [Gammaproteobacteria bacterium]